MLLCCCCCCRLGPFLYLWRCNACYCIACCWMGCSMDDVWLSRRVMELWIPTDILSKGDGDG